MRRALFVASIPVQHQHKSGAVLDGKRRKAEAGRKGCAALQPENGRGISAVWAMLAHRCRPRSGFSPGGHPGHRRFVHPGAVSAVSKLPENTIKMLLTFWHRRKPAGADFMGSPPGYIIPKIRNFRENTWKMNIEFLLILFQDSSFRPNSIDFMGEMCYNSVTLRSKYLYDQSIMEIDAND